MTTREISNSEDIVDSRDIIARIEELEEEKDQFILEHSSIPEEESPAWGDIAEAEAAAEKEWNESDEGEELKVLKALADECEGYGDWNYGATLIRDSAMNEEWARQELEDIGYISKDLPSLIADNINWRGVLEDLQQDYTEVEWDGVTYWMRS